MAEEEAPSSPTVPRNRSLVEMLHLPRIRSHSVHHGLSLTPSTQHWHWPNLHGVESQIWRKHSHIPGAPPLQKVDILVDALEAGHPLHIGENADSPIAQISNVLEDDYEKKPIFAEMMVLDQEEKEDGGESSTFWREQARWVKYEETVEEQGTRFSKPHITLLTIQSLLQLKNCLKHGTHALLDVSFQAYGDLVDTIVHHWEGRHLLLNHEESDFIRKILLADKRHVTIAGKSRTVSGSAKGQKVVTFGIVKALHVLGATDSDLILEDGLVPDDEPYQRPPGQSMNGKSVPQVVPEVQKSRSKQNLMKKMAPGSEAAVILVGIVPTTLISTPIADFIRFRSPRMLYPEMPEIELPTRFLFILLIPKDHQYETAAVDIGRTFGSMMTDEVFSRIAYKSFDNNILAHGIEEFLSQTLIVPPGKWNPHCRFEPNEDMIPATRCVAPMMEKKHEKNEDEDIGDSGLQFTGRPFGGFVDDVKRKAGFYISDFTDALTGRPTQILAASLLLFIANVTKIITFGGVMGQMLEGRMVRYGFQGAVENLLSGCICGVIYGFTAGQPLVALSATGPTLVFEFIMYDLCKGWGWDFLAVRFWVGCWTALFLMVIVATDASVIVATITRFTEEAFATLISIIFIIQAFEEMAHIGQAAPVISEPELLYNEPCMCNISEMASGFQLYSNFTPTACTVGGGSLVGELCSLKPDVFLFSIILFFGTFFIAVGLKWFRHSGFFPSKLREAIADLNVTAAVVAMTGVSVLVNVNVPKLMVPEEFKPTIDRPWVVSPMHVTHWWVIIATVLPGIFFTILVFMDQQITAVIINRKDNRLRKSFGYHLDLFVITFLILICALIGIPYYVAATIISILHVESLRVRSEASAPGEKPKFLGLNEQRVTAIVAHIMVGLTIPLTPVMKLIPFPALLGIFLYMGVVALGGQQFVQRVVIMFMPTKYQPDHTWLRVVPLKRVHLFTAIQIVSLIFLFVVKDIKSISMAFPFMLIVMVTIRNVGMARIFTKKELSALDDIVPPIKQLFTTARRTHNIPKIIVPEANAEDEHEGTKVRFFQEEESSEIEENETQPSRKL